MLRGRRCGSGGRRVGANVVGALVCVRRERDGEYRWAAALYCDAAALDADWAALRACVVEG